MAVTSEESTVGTLLRAWRTARGKSQLAVALEAGISSRHLSFVETGRSSPSREMVLTLAETLEVPLRERNALLTAAGFAAVYRETPLDAPVMNDVREALSHILRASEPNPTLVVNRRYDLLMANDAAQRFTSFFVPDWRGGPNIIRMLLAPDGLRPYVQNWHEIATDVVHRTRNELASSQTRDETDEALLRDLVTAEAELRRDGKPARAPSILVSMKMRKGDVALDLFTTITTLGTPLDITLQELRIETLFPADARAREALLRIVGSGMQ
ncbi:helix-turn-helix transcriptional regulator [Pendulispora rubella]|uniref:Helix-turn-helix transcriptional regulator n=1 Tax=Pendulispora rubella TaxID=2741070 RepID=A0ABZ2KVX1_9BACT